MPPFDRILNHPRSKFGTVGACHPSTRSQRMARADSLPQNLCRLQSLKVAGIHSIIIIRPTVGVGLLMTLDAAKPRFQQLHYHLQHLRIKRWQ